MAPAPPHVCLPASEHPSPSAPCTSLRSQTPTCWLSLGPPHVPGVARIPGLTRCRSRLAPRPRVSGGGRGCSGGGTECRARVLTTHQCMVASRCCQQRHETDTEGRAHVGTSESAQRHCCLGPSPALLRFPAHTFTDARHHVAPHCSPHSAHWPGAPYPCRTPSRMLTSACHHQGPHAGEEDPHVLSKDEI